MREDKKDENDKLQDGTLPRDPFADATPVPPLSPLPGTMNTGATAPKDGQGSDALAEIRALLGELPATGPTYLWLGLVAIRTGVYERARPAIPEAGLPAFDSARVLPEGVSLPRPVKNDTLLRRVQRALERLALPSPSEPITSVGSAGIVVHRVVHHLRARAKGGTFDLEVGTSARAVVVRDLTGAEVRSYAAVAAYAAASGLLLPPLPKKLATKIWLGILAGPFEKRETIALPELAEMEAAIEDAIAACLKNSPRGTTADELDRGHVLELESNALVVPRTLVRAVRRELADEPPNRDAILRVAASMGATIERDRKIEGARKAVVSFPLATRKESSS